MSSARHTGNGPGNDWLELCKPDPLLSLLFEKLGCSFAKLGFIAAALHLVLVLVPAGLISWAYPRNVEFLNILTLVISPVWAAHMKMKIA